MVGLCTGYGGDILLKGRGGFHIVKIFSYPAKSLDREVVFLHRG